jgi:hypothetical protein
MRQESGIVNGQECVRRAMLHAVLAIVALSAGGCATEPQFVAAVAPVARPAAKGAPRPVAVPATIDRALEDRILALDPERITADDVRNTLAKAPTSQIMLIHGGIIGVYLAMVSTGEFLAGMGYPEDRIRHAGDQRWSHSCYEDSAQIAGLLAWYYERDGARPMMIGHSQGGVQAVKVLYELAGQFDNPLHVWNPYTDRAEERTTIRDPLTGKDRPVIGVSASYVSTLDSGGIMMILPNQWKMLDKLRDIPDTVDNLTGYTIGVDFWPWPLPGFEGSEHFRAIGTAKIRNIVLPVTYDHVDAPHVAALADIPPARAWIEAYRPDAAMPAPPSEADGFAIAWAADVWHSVKKQWALEAQRVIRAKRAAPGQPVRTG